MAADDVDPFDLGLSDEHVNELLNTMIRLETKRDEQKANTASEDMGADDLSMSKLEKKAHDKEKANAAFEDVGADDLSPSQEANILQEHFNEVGTHRYALEQKYEARAQSEDEFECELKAHIDMDKCVEQQRQHASDECASEQKKADDEFASRISEYENNVEAGKVVVTLKRRITDLEEQINDLERELKKQRRVERQNTLKIKQLERERAQR